MADRRSENRRSYALLIGPTLGVVFAACGVEPMTAGLFEQVCSESSLYGSPGPSPCLLGGDAAETSGLAEGDLGFRFGPSGGTLQIRLEALPIPDAAKPVTLELLVASSVATGAELLRNVDWGSCGIYCPPSVPAKKELLGEDPAWLPLLEAVTWYPTTVPGDATLRLSGANVDLYELRFPTSGD